MRTHIHIDTELMATVMQTGQFKTRREAVEAGLHALIRRKAYQDIRALRGQMQWDDSDQAWERARIEQAQPDAARAKPAKRQTAPKVTKPQNRSAKQKGKVPA